MADKVSRAPRRASEEVRAEVLRVAAEQFAKRSYREVTTKDIATAARVSPSVMYRHFGSKADLFREATLSPLNETLMGFAQRWRAQRDVPGHWEDREIAEEFMRELYPSLVEHRDALLALASVGDELEHEVADELQRAIDGLLDQILIVGLAESAAERLWFPRERLGLAIRLLVAMVFGATAFERWLIPPAARESPEQELIGTLTDLATWGLSSRRPPRVT
jgi:AcrR family transcriptional regulator